MFLPVQDTADSPSLVLSFLMDTLWSFLLLVVGGLAVGLQSVPFFTFTFFPVLLIYTRRTLFNCLIACTINILSVSVATLTTFDIQYGTPPFTHLPRVICHSISSNLIVLISVLVDRLTLRNKNNDNNNNNNNNPIWHRVLVFPCTWTGLWYLHGYRGGQSGYSNGLSDWTEWAQLVDLGGRSFMEFILALSATCLLEYTSWIMIWRARYLKVNRLLKHPLSIYLILLMLVYTYGGVKSSFRTGLQRPIKDWIPPTETVACVIGPGGFNEELRYDYAHWIKHSEDAAQRGAKLVLWSEEVVLTSTWEDEQQLRRMAITVAKKHQIYLVIAYDRLYPVNHNIALLISPEGHLLIDYIKANPVPNDENNEPGPGALLFADTLEFGRIGIAICYDLSVPSFILQAGHQDVDILLQPAYNWGAVGSSNLRDQQLRAVENGFTFFRCISQGISGIIEPVLHGHFEQKTPTVSNQVVLFTLPIQKRIQTVYSTYLGDIVPHTCILYSLTFLTGRLYYFFNSQE